MDVGEPELEHAVAKLQRYWPMKLRAYMIKQMCHGPFLLLPAALQQKDTEGTVSPDNTPGNPMFF